jgi:predicted nucleic acid-binding protein
MKLMLDTNVLARLCHPTEYRDVQQWFRSLLERGEAAPEFLVSVIADYELRRHLLAMNAGESLRQLDVLVGSLRCVPITAETSRRAAELRYAAGIEVPSYSFDADLLMVAQAQIEGARIVTSDRRLQGIPGVVARDWDEISAES